MNTLRKYAVPLAVVAVLFIASIPLQMHYHSKMNSGERAYVNPIVSLPPADFIVGYLGSFFMGGLKSLAVDYLWIKYNELEEKKQFEEALVVMKLVANLTPYVDDVWISNAYNMIYNISVLKDTKEEQWAWISQGLTYAEDGVQWNPSSGQLKSYIGFFYFHKVPYDVADEHMAFQRARDGVDCFEKSAYWYGEAAKIYSEKRPDLAYTYDMMVFDSYQKRALLMVDGAPDYDPATKQFRRIQYPREEVMAAFRRAVEKGESIITDYDDRIIIGEKFLRSCIDSFKVLEPAFVKECDAVDALARGDLAARDAIMADLPFLYSETVKRYPGVYQSFVNKRVMSIARRHFVFPAFKAFDAGSTEEAIRSVTTLRGFLDSLYADNAGQTSSWHEYAKQIDILIGVLRLESVGYASGSDESILKAFDMVTWAIDEYPNTFVTELFLARRAEIEKHIK